MAEDVDHADFVSTYTQNTASVTFSSTVLMFMGDDSEFFGKWSADGAPEGAMLPFSTNLEDPIKHFEIRATVKFLEQIGNGQSRKRCDSAFLYLTADSIHEMKLKQLITRSQNVRVTLSFALHAKND